MKNILGSLSIDLSLLLIMVILLKPAALSIDIHFHFHFCSLWWFCWILPACQLTFIFFAPPNMLRAAAGDMKGVCFLDSPSCRLTLANDNSILSFTKTLACKHRADRRSTPIYGGWSSIYILVNHISGGFQPNNLVKKLHSWNIWTTRSQICW